MSLARLRALVIVGVLVLTAGILVIVTLVKDRQSGVANATSCPAGKVPVVLTFPEKSEDIKINIINVTTSPALAGQVADDFRSRKVTVLSEKNEPAAKPLQAVAQLRYGPKAVGTAWLVRAYFLNSAVLQFDIKREGDAVDVVLGTQFKQLGTTTEVNQALAAAGHPRLPAGTCDANAR
jgi:hypothetical protein